MGARILAALPHPKEAMPMPVETYPVMLTFDLDGESLALADDPNNAGRPGRLSPGRYGPTTGVYHILDVLEEEAVPATFFVPGLIAERYPEAVRAIKQGGHEVAHHGYTHVSPVDQTAEEEQRAMKRGLDILEELTGSRPLGYRSPSWDFSAQTLDLLFEYGFRYSSNFMDSDGPYLHESSQGSLVELPVQWMLDDAPFYLFKAPFSRPISPPSAAYETWAEELQALAERPGTSFVLTMHPQLSGRPSRVERLRQLIKLARTIPGTAFMQCKAAASLVLERKGSGQ
jgi:peptidoglycan/xylan/chitin deacetylase (PgdA/CDA1 family)